jgi:flagellar motor protein MotB
MQKQKNGKSDRTDKDNTGLESAAGFDSEFSSGLTVHSERDVFFQIQKPKTVHWSIAWSDLMMTMFILLLVMYAYQAAHREFKFGAGEEIKTPVSDVGDDGVVAQRETLGTPAINKSMLSEMFDEKGQTVRVESLEDVTGIDLVSDRAVRIVLSSDLLFDTGKADLKARAVDSLSEIAKKIKRREPDELINVVGHTDNIPISSDRFATNWELSATRASVVARYLIENENIPTRRFYITGHAYNQPLRPNNNIKNRAVNRRVEIILTKERPSGQTGVWE